MVRPVVPVKDDNTIGHARRLPMSLLVVAAAWLLRLIHLEQLGISHRDDNVYVLAARMLLAGDWTAFFDRLPVHAPPLFPLSVWAAFAWMGDYDYSAIMVSAFWGAATVGLVFYALDRWAGPAAAWTGAVVLALSPLHLAFSRIALTDACFTFFYTAGFVIAAGRLEGPRTPGRLWQSGAALGVVCAFGMYAKYQGLMIIASAVFFELFAMATATGLQRWRLPPPRFIRRGPSLAPRWPHALGSLALASLICALAWLPYRFYLNHRFGPELMHQQHLLFATPWTEILPKAPEKLLIFGVVAWLWVKGAGLLAMAGVARGLVRSPRWLWLAVGWGVAYGVALLTYTPFVRLVLPIVPLLAFAAAWAGDGLAGMLRHGNGLRRGLAMAGMALTGLFLVLQAREALLWRSDGYRNISAQLTEGRIGGTPAGDIPLVLGIDYSILYYLPGIDPGLLWQETLDEDTLGRRFYLLVDYVAWTKPVSQERLRRWEPHMRLVESVPNPRLAPTLYNPPYRSVLSSMAGRQPQPGNLTDFRLYEVTPPSSGPE